MFTSYINRIVDEATESLSYMYLPFMCCIKHGRTKLRNVQDRHDCPLYLRLCHSYDFTLKILIKTSPI